MAGEYKTLIDAHKAFSDAVGPTLTPAVPASAIAKRWVLDFTKEQVGSTQPRVFISWNGNTRQGVWRDSTTKIFRISVFVLQSLSKLSVKDERDDKIEELVNLRDQIEEALLHRDTGIWTVLQPQGFVSDPNVIDQEPFSADRLGADNDFESHILLGWMKQIV